MAIKIAYHHMKAHFTKLFLAIVLVFSAACSNQNGAKLATDSNIDSIPNPAVIVEFNSDSAYQYVKEQVDFGPRFPGSKGHTACFNYLVNRLKKTADTVYTQITQVTTYDQQLIPVKNIIAAFNPSIEKRVMLAAHWDTRPFADQDSERKNEPILGANDGASGVGVLLEVARQLSLQQPSIGIDIVFFDAEDWGDGTGQHENSFCLGSQYWTQHLHVSNYKADYCILLDMVGAPNAMFGFEGYSLKNAPTILSKIWQAGNEAGYGQYFKNFERGAIYDDHYYIMKDLKIKTVDIIDFDPNTPMKFGKYWHTHADNMSAISKPTLKAVGQTVINVIYAETLTEDKMN